jgi:hypothetical protein
MPTPYAAQIADALAAGLAGYEFSPPFATIAPVRRYVPDYDVADLGPLHVSVVPGPITTEKTARGSDLFQHQIAVVLAKQTDGTNADLDALATLAEEILDAIRSDVLTTPAMPDQARYLSAEMETSLDRDAMTDRRVFLAQIAITYHLPRPKLAP